MPRKRSFSFRILYPDPFDFSRPSSFPHELGCSAEFSGQTQALQFQKVLLGLPHAHHVRLEKKNTFNVFWVMSFKQALLLPEVRGVVPGLSLQISRGLKGFVRDDFWDIPGRGNKRFRWAHKTQVMGILNVTPDSFSDGGSYLDPGIALERALQMQEEGADWVDVGGESTRPGAKAVSAQEEKKRILPVIKACVKALRIPLSVDTYKADVARAAVGEGAQMVNDIGALGLDPHMGKTIAGLKVPVVLMHMQGNPRTMQKKPAYSDVMGDLIVFFRDRIEAATELGISGDRILIDPGFGFGKEPWHNIEITRRLWELKILGCPLMMGPSRKSTLGFILGGAPAEKRVEATAAAVTASILKGADFVRVHDVKALVPVVKIADALRYDRGLTKP